MTAALSQLQDKNAKSYVHTRSGTYQVFTCTLGKLAFMTPIVGNPGLGSIVGAAGGGLLYHRNDG